MELPPQRLATTADAGEIQALMHASIRDLFPRFYDRAHGERRALHRRARPGAVEDGTYYVHEAGGECRVRRLEQAQPALHRLRRRRRRRAAARPGTEPARVRAMFVRDDWTRRGLGRAILERCERDALAEGFTTMALMATLPGQPLYRAYGFARDPRTWCGCPTAPSSPASRWSGRAGAFSSPGTRAPARRRC